MDSKKNINLLYNKDFRFEILRLPETTYYCQKVTIPSLSVGVIKHPNPFVEYQVQGDHLVFEPLVVEFNVDEDLRNYEELVNWIQAYSFPASYNQYTTSPNLTPKQAHKSHFSDGTIFTSTNKDNPNVQFVFEGLFPTDISSLDLNLAIENPEPLVCTATFAYTKFTLSR